MTDAERWRVVAAWFEEAAETGDFTSDRVRLGLCAALNAIDNPDGNYDSRCHMALKNTDFLWLHRLWPPYCSRAGARFRATLAPLMAHMAEDDGGNHKADA